MAPSEFTTFNFRFVHGFPERCRSVGPVCLCGQDVAALAVRLPGLVTSQQVAWPLWQHLDFLWGIDAAPLVYRHVLRFLEDFSGPRRRQSPSATS